MKNYNDSVFDRIIIQAVAFNGNDSCWDWKMSRTKAGYGQLSYEGKDGKRSIAYAHRAMFEIANGYITQGMCICHKCDNPACFNPSHLFQGTQKDNAQDMARKKRSNIGKKFPQGDKHWSKKFPKRGSLNGNSKLTEDQGIFILQSPDTHTSLAKRFGVSITLVSDIRKRKVWKHLPIVDQQYFPRSRKSTP